MKKREFKAGDSVKNISANRYDLTIGKVYEAIYLIHNGYVTVTDDVGDTNHIRFDDIELVPEFEQGQMVEVSDSGVNWYEREYLCKDKFGVYVCYGGNVKTHHIPWNRCRHIQTKPVPKYTMEQVIKLVGHEFEIKD